MKRITSLFILLLIITTTSAQTLKEWRDSLDVINKRIELHPQSLELKLEKAAISLQLLEWEDAIEACNEVTEKDMNNLSALFYRAYANNNLRRYELARNDYEHFLRISPRNLEARIGLAYTYSKMGKDMEAKCQY